MAVTNGSTQRLKVLRPHLGAAGLTSSSNGRWKPTSRAAPAAPAVTPAEHHNLGATQPAQLPTGPALWEPGRHLAASHMQKRRALPSPSPQPPSRPQSLRETCKAVEKSVTRYAKELIQMPNSDSEAGEVSTGLISRSSCKGPA